MMVRYVSQDVLCSLPMSCNEVYHRKLMAKAHRMIRQKSSGQVLSLSASNSVAAQRERVLVSCRPGYTVYSLRTSPRTIVPDREHFHIWNRSNKTLSNGTLNGAIGSSASIQDALPLNEEGMEQKARK